ncbi:MAG TPA: polyprenol monophosphomannose synthase [Bacteroidia bacterium]|jgi:dolichol-phosphate mannosyltransferase|nr:polyprenol monophosphomannose synthase [Bacteroidia bacterium]
MSDSLVIIPTYNEKGNIESIARKVLSLPGDFHLLVIDDGSPDGTATIVKNLMNEFPDRLFIIERAGKLGLGTAYIAGFQWALKKSYEFIFEMDADFSHNPEDLLRLKEACVKGADLAIGSRYVKGGDVKNWDVKRVLMSYFASVYVRTVLWISVKDTTAGFKCYRRRVLEALPLDNIKFIGYAFQIEMKYLTHKLKFKIVEVPITFIDRQVGISKMSKGIFKEAFWGVIQMRLGKHGK